MQMDTETNRDRAYRQQTERHKDKGRERKGDRETEPTRDRNRNKTVLRTHRRKFIVQNHPLLSVQTQVSRIFEVCGLILGYILNFLLQG
jgi:hypothetical protein